MIHQSFIKVHRAKIIPVKTQLGNLNIFDYLDFEPGSDLEDIFGEDCSCWRKSLRTAITTGSGSEEPYSEIHLINCYKLVIGTFCGRLNFHK